MQWKAFKKYVDKHDKMPSKEAFPFIDVKVNSAEGYVSQIGELKPPRYIK